MILSERDVVASNSVNDRDHGAVVVVTAAFGTTCFLVFFLARLAIRWPLRSLSGIDDLVLLVATVCIRLRMLNGPLLNRYSALRQHKSALSLVLYRQDLGKQSSRRLRYLRQKRLEISSLGRKKTNYLSNTRQLLYASDLLYIAAKFLSRLVVGLMFIRLSTSASQTRVSRTILGAGIAFGVTAIVMFAVQPNSYGTKNVIDPESIVSRHFDLLRSHID